MSWNTNASYSSGAAITAALIGGVGLDLRTWGGSVDAGGFALSNIATITGASSVLTVSGELDVTAAAAILKVTSSTGTNRAYLRFNNTGGNTYIGVESSAGASLVVGGLAYATIISTDAALALQLGTNNNARLTIASGGQVGIGVTSPYTSAGNKLHVHNTTDQNLLHTSFVNLADGVSLQSLNDAVNAFKGFELLAARIKFNSSVTRYMFTGLPTYASNALALAGGLVANEVYTDGAGAFKVVF